MITIIKTKNKCSSCGTATSSYHIYWRNTTTRCTLVLEGVSWKIWEQYCKKVFISTRNSFGIIFKHHWWNVYLFTHFHNLSWPPFCCAHLCAEVSVTIYDGHKSWARSLHLNYKDGAEWLPTSPDERRLLAWWWKHILLQQLVCSKTLLKLNNWNLNLIFIIMTN